MSADVATGPFCGGLAGRARPASGCGVRSAPAPASERCQEVFSVLALKLVLVLIVSTILSTLTLSFS
ncbi:MAG: hypothetical protein R3344_14170, partial [Acidobacteriota bacterium]|nr:hypothetical protein [Acidobacteriota bacterium]